MPAALEGASPHAYTLWSRFAGVVLPVTLVGAVLVFIVPVPPAVLDLLQAANITLAVLVLLTTLAIRSPSEFAALSDDPAHDDADPAGPERGHDPAGPHPRRLGAGTRCGGGRHPGVRRVRRGGSGGRRGDPLRRSCWSSSSSSSPRGRRGSARSPPGSCSTASRAADGHRRRPPRRPDRPARGQEPPPRGRVPDGRLLRGDGRGGQVRPRRRRGRAHHHRRQHHRRARSWASSSTA